MIGVLAIAIGSLMLYLGMSDSMPSHEAIKNALHPSSGPSLGQFLVGGAVASAPLALMIKNPSWAWKYVILILAAVALTHPEDLSEFAGTLGDFFSGKLETGPGKPPKPPGTPGNPGDKPIKP